MTKILIKDSHFLIEIALWGVGELHHQPSKGLMFGRLIDELKCTVSFEGKNEFITLCNRINKERIALVHGLTLEPDEKQIRIKTTVIAESYQAAEELFWSAHGWFVGLFENERREMLSVNPAPLRNDG